MTIDPTSLVTLTVGGIPYQGWTSVSITEGIEQLARSFALTASLPRATEPLPQIARPGDLCTVSIGADLVLTGYVDTIQPRGDANGRSLAISGRSRTCDAVDCSAEWPTGQFRLMPLEALATALCAPHAIAVRAQTVTGAPFPLVRIEAGETIQQALERLAVQRAVLLTDDALGNLVITRAGLVPAATALIGGVNIIESEATLSAAEVYQTYVVRGQHAGSDLDFAMTATTPLGLALDTSMGRPRKLIVAAEGGTDIARAKVRASWEAANRAGKSCEGTFVVQGWRQFPGGPLWASNQLVAIVDPVTTFNGVFLVVEVSRTLDDKGMRTTLRCAPPSAYEPLAPAERPPAVVGSRGREGVTAYPELAL